MAEHDERSEGAGTNKDEQVVEPVKLTVKDAFDIVLEMAENDLTTDEQVADAPYLAMEQAKEQAAIAIVKGCGEILEKSRRVIK